LSYSPISNPKSTTQGDGSYRCSLSGASAFVDFSIINRGGQRSVFRPRSVN